MTAAPIDFTPMLEGLQDFINAMEKFKAAIQETGEAMSKLQEFAPEINHAERRFGLLIAAALIILAGLAIPAVAWFL